MVFTKSVPPAVAVWIPGGPAGRVVFPVAWMSLSGRPQARPDRNTRGWIGPHGQRHWLDVFPDIAGAPSQVVVPKWPQSAKPLAELAIGNKPLRVGDWHLTCR